MHESKVHNVVVLQDSATESMVANLAGRLADNSMAFLVENQVAESHQNQTHQSNPQFTCAK